MTTDQRAAVEQTLATLQAERDELDAAIATLRRVLGAPPEVPAGNAQAPAAAKKPAPGKGERGRTPRDVPADRKALAELLEKHGQLRTGELLEQSGLPASALRKALDDARFKKGPGKFDPWALA